MAAFVALAFALSLIAFAVSTGMAVFFFIKSRQQRDDSGPCEWWNELCGVEDPLRNPIWPKPTGFRPSSPPAVEWPKSLPKPPIGDKPQ
jgi:hypothetical protein